jgi:hypothetical protein
MKKLKQRHLFERKELLLTSNGLSVSTYTWKEGFTHFVPYEDLGLKRVYRVQRINWLLVAAFVAIFSIEFGLFVSEWHDGADWPKLLFWLSSAVLFGACAIIAGFDTRKRTLLLTGGPQTLALYADQPSRQQVELFADALEHRIRQRHLRTFMAEESLYTPEYRLTRLRWLRQIGAVSDTQFRRLVQRPGRQLVPVGALEAAAQGYSFSIN